MSVGARATARPAKVVPRQVEAGVHTAVKGAARNGHYRSRKLLDLAHKITECQVKIPGVCQGYSPEGCEPAHSNQQRHGKGKGLKAEDCFYAAACHACHVELDQGHALSREEKARYWQLGFENTYRRLLVDGLLIVGK